MSRGFFDYKQHHIHDIYSTIENVIENDGIREEEDWSSSMVPKPMLKIDRFDDATLEERIIIMDQLNKLYIDLKDIYEKIHLVDSLLSSDIGAETYIKRLKEFNFI